MIKRKAEKKIHDWIKNGGYALFISGARQVGKTSTVRKCLEEYACDSDQTDVIITEYFEIDLADDTDLVDVINQSKSAGDLILNISLAGHFTLHGSNTILFIDNAQECPEIAEKILTRDRDNICRFIVCGTSFRDEFREYGIRTVDRIRMYPLDFEEYLQANGVEESVIGQLRYKFNNAESVAEASHRKLMEYFRQYILAGGMPAAAEKYLQTGDISEAMKVQKDIIELYRNDFMKTDCSDKKLRMSAMFSVIPRELLRSNKRFRYADIDKRLKAGRAEVTLTRHEEYGDIISVYHTSAPRSPLKRNIRKNLVKLYLSDVGLLNCMLRAEHPEDMELSENQSSALYENAVAQELAAHGCDIYYYNDHSLGELDFLIEHGRDPLPIEVQCGKGYYRHSAVKNVTGSWDLRIPNSIVLSEKNVSRKGDITYYPVYMAMFISEDM